MIYEYHHFKYKQGIHGYVFVLSGDEWVRSSMTWAEIEKRGRKVESV